MPKKDPMNRKNRDILKAKIQYDPKYSMFYASNLVGREIKWLLDRDIVPYSYWASRNCWEPTKDRERVLGERWEQERGRPLNFKLGQNDDLEFFLRHLLFQMLMSP